MQAHEPGEALAFWRSGEDCHCVCPGNVCEAWEFVRAPLLPGLMCHAFVGREGSADLFCSSPSRQSPLLALPCQLFYSLSSWTSSLLVSSVVLALGPWVWTLQCILLLLPNSAVLLSFCRRHPPEGIPGSNRDWTPRHLSFLFSLVIVLIVGAFSGSKQIWGLFFLFL